MKMYRDNAKEEGNGFYHTSQLQFKGYWHSPSKILHVLQNFSCVKKNHDAKTSKLSIIIILERKKVYYVNVLF
jgi:hypothetical protein